MYIGESFVKGGKTYYHCTCDCGNSVDVCHYDLRDGNRTTCSKCADKVTHDNRVINLKGKRFGKLIVLDEDPIRHKTFGGETIIKWRCLCDCGNTTIVSSAALRNGQKTSCGCDVAKKYGISYEEYKRRYCQEFPNGKRTITNGMRFGNLVTESPTKGNNGKSAWICVCDCGSRTVVLNDNLLSGHTQSCGCINSVGESIIARYLDSQDVSYKRRYTFEDCRDARPLPFDFAVFDKRNSLVGMIEYDGEQHFAPVRFNGMTDERAVDSFFTGIYHDEIKNKYCENNNIPLLRIKFDSRDNIDSIVYGFLKEVG